MNYPGINGFLGTRASIMLDVVFLAMFAVIPLMGVAIYLVKFRRLYTWHKRIQLALGVVLLLAITAFEVDMQFISGWRERARESPYFDNWVFYSLYIHLVFAVSTALLWVFVIVQALRKIPVPAGPSKYSGAHAFWGKLAAADMFMTSLTGWIFYGLAFAA